MNKQEYIEYCLGNNQRLVERDRHNDPKDGDLLPGLAKMALGELAVPENVRQKLHNVPVYRYSRRFLQEILYGTVRDKRRTKSCSFWSLEDPFIKGLLAKDTLYQQDSPAYMLPLVCSKLAFESGGESKAFIDRALELGVTEDALIIQMLRYSSPFEIIEMNPETRSVEYSPSGFAEFILPKLKPSSSLLGLKKSRGRGQFIHDLVKSQMHLPSKFAIFKFLLRHDPEVIGNEHEQYLMNRRRDGEVIPLPHICAYALDKDAERFEAAVAKIAEASQARVNMSYPIYELLDQSFPGKYSAGIDKVGEEELNSFVNQTSTYPYFTRANSKEIVVSYSKLLLDRDFDKGLTRIRKFVNESAFISTSYVRFIFEELKPHALPLLMTAMEKDAKLVDMHRRGYFKSILSKLKEFDLGAEQFDQLLELAVERAGKPLRRTLATFLAQYPEYSTGKARELCAGKKVDQRITGALILSHSQEEAVLDELQNLVELERNDETRNVMLESVQDRKFSQDYDVKAVMEMIDFADKRKKLNRWAEKWIEEESLPAPVWKHSGEALSQKEIRFLFYRSKQAKGLNSDIEARQLIRHLDKDKSEKFALAVLQGFQDSNASSKFKYYLTITGLIGGDKLLPKLNTTFRKGIADKRFKMCEYIVGAIAMVGSNKALRVVEMLSRKYANKRAKIGLAAREALDAAAVELNISRDQLGDRIIPNFGFENLYKEFEAGGEPYRAFVSKEFKLNYFNQDNKLRKSIPKDTDKELVKELKEIDKEIKAVVKTQKGRLETALIEGRRWTTEEWQEYFLNNPIMLIYVQKLLWGLYKDGQLLEVFLCDDDIELYNVTDDEVDLDAGEQIGIVHPIEMNEALLKQWKEKVYENDMEFEFPILERAMFRRDPEEMQSSITKRLWGQEIPKGADYVAGFLEKRGWQKQSADGGRLEFYRNLQGSKHRAYANIEGPAAFYQGGAVEATVWEIAFLGENWSDKPKIENIPAVFYSEVIADINALINA